jgi:arylsulfatase A
MKQRIHRFGIVATSFSLLSVLGMSLSSCSPKSPISSKNKTKISSGSEHKLGQAGMKPNIIYILADDLGIADIGCYHHLKVANQNVKIETPNLDALCAEGMAFTNQYAGAAVCAPTRNSLLTGQHTGHTRVRGNSPTAPNQPEGSMALQAEDITVAQVLKNAGYTSGIIGKWGVGNIGTTGTPNQKGFDYSYGVLDQVHAHNHYPPSLIRNGNVEAIPENAGNSLTQAAAPGKKFGKYANDLFTEDALNFVQNNKTKPFHLQLWYTLPHAGLEVPEDSRAPYINMWGAETPFAGNNYPAQSHPRATYAAMITRMDRDIGRLMQSLKDSGLDEKTIVFFGSDNGSSIAGGIDRVFFNSMGPYRDHKASLYEGGIRSPFIARWPGVIPSGSMSNELTASWDFLATAAELAGTAAPATDGISIVPSLLGQNQTKKHDILYWEKHTDKGLWQAARKGEWKLVKNDDNHFELYNLVSDPSETRDMYDSQPDVVKEIKQKMAHAHTPGALFPAGSLDLLGIPCNANRTATGRFVDAGARSIVCLQSTLSATGFSWQPLDIRNVEGVQCNASGEAANKVNGALTCSPEPQSPTKWIWKNLSAQSNTQQATMEQQQTMAVPNPNDANSYIGYQCNLNGNALGKLEVIGDKSIVCLQGNNSPTGYAWQFLNAANPIGVQCNKSGLAPYGVNGALTCAPEVQSPTGWNWQPSSQVVVPMQEQPAAVVPVQQQPVVVPTQQQVVAPTQPQVTVPDPNNVNTYLGVQCNQNQNAAGRLVTVGGEQIVCMEAASSATGFAWQRLNPASNRGVQCNASGDAAYRVAFGLTCRPWTGAFTGWRWQ